MTSELRDLVSDAARIALAEVGGDPTQVDRGAIVRRFEAQGAKRTSAFRWVAATLDLADEQYSADKLPPIPAVVLPRGPVFRDDVDVSSMGPTDVLSGTAIELVSGLISCVQAAQDVMRHARKEDGSVRLPKTLMQASEHLRKTLETTARLHESMVTLQKLDRYMEAIFAELKDEAPEVAQRVLGRLRAVNTRYRASAAGSS